MCGADELGDVGAELVSDLNSVKPDAAAALVGAAGRDEFLTFCR